MMDLEIRNTRRLLRRLPVRPGVPVQFCEDIVPGVDRWLNIRVPITDDVRWSALCERIWNGGWWKRVRTAWYGWLWKRSWAKMARDLKKWGQK